MSMIARPVPAMLCMHRPCRQEDGIVMGCKLGFARGLIMVAETPRGSFKSRWCARVAIREERCLLAD